MPLMTSARPMTAGEPPASSEPAVRFPRTGLGIIIIIVFLGGVGSLIRVPYFSVAPGPTRNVLTLVEVDGIETFPSRGSILLTTAQLSTRSLSLWESVWVWLDPGVGAIHRDRIIAPGVSEAEQHAVNVFDIEFSKLSAERAVFAVLGTPARHVRGAEVLAIVPGSPADGRLELYDQIIEIAGREVASNEAAAAAISAWKPGSELEFLIRRHGDRRRVKVTPRGVDGQPRIGVLLSNVFEFPHDVEIDTQHIVGPSAGLAFALSLLDLLTEEDLTRGNTVAVTGTIDSRGRVGPIGGLSEKVRAAERDGATVFIVPVDEAEDARALAPFGLRVIGVSTLGEAVRALRSLPQQPPAA